MWNCACQRGRAAATGALSTHSAPAPSQGRNLAKQARMKLGQEAPCSPTPGALSQAQKDRAQKITPADPTQPPSSSREFSQPCARRNCTGSGCTASGRAYRTPERARAAWQAAAWPARPAATAAESRILPILLGNRILRTPRPPCVYGKRSFRRRAVPYAPWSERRPRGPRGGLCLGAQGCRRRPQNRDLSRYVTIRAHSRAGA